MTRPVTHPSEPKIQRLPVSDIEVAAHRLRPVSEAGVQGLIASIAQIGVIKDAIHVRRMRRASGQRLVLMAGGHRLEAARRLGWQTIPARVWADVTDDFARLMEIDDNLSAAELTCLEMSVILAERKRIYERLHPETKAGGPRGNQHTGGRQTEIISFCQSVAEKRDLSARHIRNLVRIGNALGADEIAALYAAKNPIKFKDLKKLSALCDPADRRYVIGQLAAGHCASLGEALAQLRPRASAPVNAEDQALIRLATAWARAPMAVKRRFVADERASLRKLLGVVS